MTVTSRSSARATRELAAAQRAVDRVRIYRPSYCRELFNRDMNEAMQRYLKAGGRLRMAVRTPRD